MPVYEFRCRIHGRFDVEQRMTENHIAICKKCNKPATRVFEPLAFMGDFPGNPRPRMPHTHDPAEHGPRTKPLKCHISRDGEMKRKDTNAIA
jgi:putative FmdB family regulatory protein